MDNNGGHLPQVENKPVNKAKLFLRIFLWITLPLLVAGTVIVFNTNLKNLFLSQKTSIPEPMEPEKDSVTIKMIFAGDLMGHMPWINSGLKNGAYRYDTAYTYIRPYIQSADYAMLNLETTLNGPPYSGYPMFSSPDALAHDAFKAGFDFMALSNNHCADRGKQGIRRTIHVLDSLKIPHTGVYNDTAGYKKDYPTMIQVKGINIAVLNYTYSTNGMPVYAPNYISMIDSTVILEDIKNAKAKKPDLIISIMHWGEEYSRTQSDRQERFARLMAANGVDVVFGAHPHVVQPIVTLPSAKDSSRQVPVFYSTGNFISNQRDPYRDGGIFAEVHITKVEGKTWVSGFGYLPFWIRKNEVNRSYVAIPLNSWEKNGGSFHLPTADSLLAAKFLNDTRKLMGNNVDMVK